jgi:hypothetical protein
MSSKNAVTVSASSLEPVIMCSSTRRPSIVKPRPPEPARVWRQTANARPCHRQQIRDLVLAQGTRGALRSDRGQCCFRPCLPSIFRNPAAAARYIRARAAGGSSPEAPAQLLVERLIGSIRRVIEVAYFTRIRSRFSSLNKCATIYPHRSIARVQGASFPSET